MLILFLSRKVKLFIKKYFIEYGMLQSISNLRIFLNNKNLKLS